MPLDPKLPPIPPAPTSTTIAPSPAVGVAFNEPPSLLLMQAHKLLDDALKTLPPETNGALIGLATNAGWNAAVVTRVNDHVHVAAWVGKSWGSQLTGGTAVRATW